MPQFRTPQGAIVTIPEDQASSAVASGYEPVSVEQAGAVTSAVTPEDRGVLGAINAGATGLLSGATLGLSDYALKGLLDKGEFERLASEREAHPIASGLGQVAGAVIPAFGGPVALLAKTPAGALSRVVAPLAAEGAGGLLAAGAAEGALQNAGAYLSDTALGDRDLTAEGMFGALGAGGAFGVAGGAAALGIEKGMIAARRLFSRAAGADKVALNAEQAWQAAHQSALEAHDAAADIAKAQLAEARMAREQAQLAKQRAGLRVVETEQGAPTIDAAYRAAQVERDQVRDAAKAAYEAQPAITPQMREGLRGLGLTDADIAASSPADLAAAMRLVEGADSELAAMSAPRPMSPAKEASLSQAVAEHDAARQELDDLLRNMEAPAIEPGIAPPQREVPIGEFGAPGQRGYDPGNVRPPGPPSLAEGPLGQGTPQPVTVVGKRLGEGTPVGAVPAEGAPGASRAPAAEIAGEQQFRALQSDLRSKLTDEEIRLSKRYTADNYTDVNRLLRGEGSVLSKKEAEEIVPALDSILEKARTESPIVTHRAVVFDPHESGFALKPGDVFTDPAYMSTSYKSDNIGRFGNVHFVITSPAGTRIGAVPSLKSEGEMLLARGSKLRITGREELPGKDIAGRPKIRLHAIVEPDGAGASAGRTVTARPTQEASDDLTAALQGTSSKLGEGKAIGQIGAESPARAEYVANKAAKTEADAAHFRARANERNYAGSDMAAAERAAQAVARDERAATEAWAERAAILEYEGGYSRADAERLARDEINNATRGPGAEPPPVQQSKKNLKRTEAAKKAAAASVERLHEIHSAVASNLPQELQSAWEREGYKFLREESGRIRGMKDRINAASKISEAFTEKYGAGSETLRGYEGDRFYRRAQIEAEHADSWAKEQERKYYAAATRDEEHRINKDSELSSFFSSLTRPKTRDAYVAANIGRAMREEGSHAAALAKVEREWAAMGGAPTGPRPGSSARHPMAVAKLERDLDAAVERAALAADPVEHAVAQQEVRTLEEQLSQVGARPGAVEDVAAAANVITKYERAAAKLTEELGPSAPPAAQEAAKAFRAAEEEADRKTMARTTRAIDDGVDSKGRPRTVEYTARKESEAKMAAGSAPPAPARPTWDELEAKYGKYVGQPALPPTSKEAIAAAKAEQKGADVAYKRTKVAETEARIGARRAQDIADQTRATAGKARPVTAAPPQMGTLGSIATAIGIAGEIGVPGVPHPKDIPVIGPLLSLYLKYKALKYATGRFVGRIGATGDSKAAALAAKTKDKIATAVDKTLGLVETGARKGRPAIVAASTVLGHRIFDDGEPDAKTGASDREMAAVRIREIANAATRPDLVKQYVARELRSVVDPDLHEAAERHLMARFEYLADAMPKAPPPNPYSKREWLPSQADTNTLAQRLSVVHDPASAFSDPTPAKVDTLRNVSPRLLQLAQERLTERIADTKNPVPYPQRLRASRLYGIPLDDSLDPQSISIIQSSHALNRPAPTPQPASPPVSSIAADTNLTSLYQTGMDRRAAR